MRLSERSASFAESFSRAGRGGQDGSVLIIVLWIAFGLVSIALFFGNTMMVELRAADNRVAAMQADQAIEGAARYVRSLLLDLEEPGQLPDPLTYKSEEVPVGEAVFWLIGRAGQENTGRYPYYSLLDESSKLNLNTATAAMLEALPGMTAEIAAAIVDWRDADSEPSPNGVEAETYLRQNPSYRCKNAPFESVEELRLVFGMTVELLYGEDINRNGLLDSNEDDGEQSEPMDNRDGKLDSGLIEWVTVYSREPNTRADGTPRLNVGGAGQAEVQALLQETFGNQRAAQIQQLLGAGGQTFGSLLEYFIRSGMTPDEFAQVEGELSVTNATYVDGLINVNTASSEVLAAVPGIGPENAPQLVAQRQSNPATLNSVAWVSTVLSRENAIRAGRYLTGRGYQCSADIVAVGRHGRGFRRSLFIFDWSEGEPKILFRRDLESLGWALGMETRRQMLAKEGRS